MTSRARCWAGRIGGAITGFLFGVTIGANLATTFMKIGLIAHGAKGVGLIVALLVGVIGAVGGTLTGMAQFCKEEG